MSIVLARVVTSDSWAYLDAVARVQGLTFAWDYPGGPTSAECSLDAAPGLHIPALRQGATMTLHRGASTVWQGRVANIDRDGWRIQAGGLGGLATREPVSVTGSLDSIVDAAITGGLPWTRPASLSATSWTGGEGATEVGQTMLDEVLSTVLEAEGKVWKVDVTGKVSSEVQPSSPALVIRADTVPPTTLNDYATHITARYWTTSTYGANARYATVTVSNSSAAAKFGRVNRSIDLSPMGVLTSTQATTYAQKYLDKVSPRMTVAGDFDVHPGQVTTASGSPIDLAFVRPGQVARVQLVSLIRDTLLIPTTSIDMLIGATKFDVDSDRLTLSPASRAASPLEVMFGGRATTWSAA